MARCLSSLEQPHFHKFIPHQVRHSALAKQDDAVRVRSFGHVIYAPAIGGLGEFLVIDEHQHGFETDRDTTRQNGFFELGLATMNFADLKSDMATWLQYAVQLVKYLRHSCLPGIELFRHR